MSDDKFAVDPVCGKKVNTEETQFKLNHAGKTYYFDSAACKFKFQAQLGKESDQAPRRVDFPRRTGG